MEAEYHLAAVDVTRNAAAGTKVERWIKQQQDKR
jgi:hypothetical protein